MALYSQALIDRLSLVVPPGFSLHLVTPGLVELSYGGFTLALTTVPALVPPEDAQSSVTDFMSYVQDQIVRQIGTAWPQRGRGLADPVVVIEAGGFRAWFGSPEVVVVDLGHFSL